MSSNFQGRPIQLNDQGWWWKKLPPLSQNPIFRQKVGEPQNQQKFPSPILIIYLAWPSLKIWAQSDLWLRLWMSSAGRGGDGTGRDGTGRAREVIIQTTSAQAFAFDLALALGLGWGLSTRVEKCLTFLKLDQRSLAGP